MEIAKLKENMRDVDVEGKITFLDGPQDYVSKYGKPGKRTYVVLTDASGGIGMTLWNKDAERVLMGDIVQIIGGFTSMYKQKDGEAKLQLNVSNKETIVRISTPGQQKIPQPKLPEGGRNSSPNIEASPPSASGKGTPDILPAPMGETKRQIKEIIRSRANAMRISAQKIINDADDLEAQLMKME